MEEGRRMVQDRKAKEEKYPEKGEVRRKFGGQK